MSQNDVHMYLVLSHIAKYFVICTHAHTIILTLSPERERKLKYNEACELKHARFALLLMHGLAGSEMKHFPS